MQEVLGAEDQTLQRYLYFGLEGTEALTLEQIGAGVGITRERVRQIKEMAFSKLRHPLRASALRKLAGPVLPA